MKYDDFIITLAEEDGFFYIHHPTFLVKIGNICEKIDSKSKFEMEFEIVERYGRRNNSKNIIKKRCKKFLIQMIKDYIEGCVSLKKNLHIS